MLIKDLSSGNTREYGTNCHDSLMISQDGKSLVYYNMQCGESSQFGNYRFVLDDDEVPEESNTPEAIHCECYADIGGFKNIYREAYKQGQADLFARLRQFPIRRNNYDREHGNIDFISGIETVMEYIEELEKGHFL